MFLSWPKFWTIIGVFICAVLVIASVTGDRPEPKQPPKVDTIYAPPAEPYDHYFNI